MDVRSRGRKDTTIRDLLAYRLHRLANRISASAARRYKREFAVSLGEWRTVALLGAEAPMSLSELSRSAGLDKGQASRVVRKLVKRRIAVRGSDENDGRGIRLELTAGGRKLYRGLIAAASERNRRLLGALAPSERGVFLAMLAKLETEARTLYREERER